MDYSRQDATAVARVVVVVGVVFASFSSIIIRYSTAPALIIAFYRMLFASILLFPLFMIEIRRTGFRIELRDLVKMSAGGLFLGLHFALWISSLSLTSVSSSVV